MPVFFSAICPLVIWPSSTRVPLFIGFLLPTLLCCSTRNGHSYTRYIHSNYFNQFHAVGNMNKEPDFRSNKNASKWSTKSKYGTRVSPNETRALDQAGMFSSVPVHWREQNMRIYFLLVPLPHSLLAWKKHSFILTVCCYKCVKYHLLSSSSGLFVHH